MSPRFRNDQIEHWEERLNALIPQEVNGNQDDGERMVEFVYQPNSVRIITAEAAPEEEALTLCYLTVTYLVERREAIGARLREPIMMPGTALVMVDAGGAMVLDDTAFLDGLLVPPGTPGDA